MATNNNKEDGDVLMNQAAFLRALEKIPTDEKSAYLHAQSKAPELVERESPIQRQLVVTNGNVDKAVRRLVSYWKYRRQIFGEDLAFLPLTLTLLYGEEEEEEEDDDDEERGKALGQSSGSGASSCVASSGRSERGFKGRRSALGKEEREVFNSGVFVKLPNDKKGRSVLCVDRSKLSPAYSYPQFDKHRYLLSFYLINLCCENPVSQTEGIVIISKVEGVSPSQRVMDTFNTLYNEAFPVRTVEWHLVLPTNPSNYGGYLQPMIDHILNLIGYQAQSAVKHRASSEGEMLQKLVKAGFARRNIPVWVTEGGQWDMDNFEDWKKRQKRVEEDRVYTEAELAEKRRKAVAIQSRQKRRKKNAEFELLRDRCHKLRMINMNLRASNSQLERLLSDAHNEVSFFHNLSRLEEWTGGAESPQPQQEQNQQYQHPQQQHQLQQYGLLPQPQALPQPFPPQNKQYQNIDASQQPSVLSNLFTN